MSGHAVWYRTPDGDTVRAHPERGGVTFHDDELAVVKRRLRKQEAAGEIAGFRVRPLAGTPADKLLTVLRHEIGVHESGGNNRGQRVEEYQHRAGGVAGESWCGDLVDWAIIEAGFDLDGHARYVPSLVTWAKTNGHWHVSGNRPERGWRVVFDWTGDGKADHIGVVETVIGIRDVWTIEGNSSTTTSRSENDGDGVDRHHRTGKVILGYVDLDALKAAR